MWREIDFPLIETPRAGLRFIEDLAAMYSNGSVLHKSFAIPGHLDFMAFVNTGALHATFFFERFWQTKSVARAFPYVLNDVRFLAPDTFRLLHPVELSGSMARALVKGGAYTTVPMPARRAMKIADQAADSLLAGDFESPLVFVSGLPWSSFFYDVAWDYTWLILRPGDSRIEVILTTETD